MLSFEASGERRKKVRLYAAEPPARIQATSPTNAHHNPGTRILIVADDGAVSEALEDSLRTAGHPSNCLACASVDAVSEAESYEPGLLVVDLPPAGSTDCIELAETIR